FWSYVNYRMLIGGKKPQIAAEKATAEERGSLVVEQQPYPKADASVSVRETISSQEQKGSERSEIKYCHKCGSRLLSDSKFCYRCGTKTP
ncbi:MAG: zinc ribbon domain-containing protein, partial [Bacillota bacterium]